MFGYLFDFIKKIGYLFLKIAKKWRFLVKIDFYRFALVKKLGLC